MVTWLMDGWIFWVIGNKPQDEWTRDRCNGPLRDGSHRGPRDQCKPHVSGGSEDSRHVIRALFERVTTR